MAEKQSASIGKTVYKPVQSNALDVRYPVIEQFGKPTKLLRMRLWLEARTYQVSHYVTDLFIFEFERGLGFNFVPVILGLGICSYFAVPEEPSLWMLVSVFVLLASILKKTLRYNIAFRIFAIGFLLVAGMLAAKLQVEWTDNSVVETQLTTEVTGLVIGVDRNRRGSPRYIIRPIALVGWQKADLPQRLRLSVPGKDLSHKPGDVIQGLARIQPVLGPVVPGGYDFAFFGRFEGLGGSGFFMGRPSGGANPQQTRIDIKDLITIHINRVRISISERIQRALPDTSGKIATALVVGDKTGIPPDIQEALRATGLAHILAISGLHMALVTLTIIWIIRGIFVFQPHALLNFPVKKWAACAGLAFATVYLFLSGMGVATQRAWIMICVMLLAVLADRKAITMRSVAISALIILILKPHSVLTPGFQMSFAAVASLVAAYGAIKEWQQRRSERSAVAARSNKSKLFFMPFAYFGSLAITSLVAGFATSFIAAWHFQQFAPYGLLANLLVMPIVTSLIMPAVLFAIVLMPFGAEFLALYPVALGIDKVVSVAFWVQDIGPAETTGLLPGSSFSLFLAALLTITLFRTRLRFLSFVPFFFIPLAITKPKVPDLLISENGRSIVFNNAIGGMVRLYPKRENFVTRSWAKAYADGRTTSANLNKDVCNSDRCITVLPSSLVLHIVYDPKLLFSSCQRADILVAPRLKWVNCRGRVPLLILKRGDLEKYGTHTIYINPNRGISRQENKPDDHIAVQTAYGIPTRPWHREVDIAYEDE